MFETRDLKGYFQSREVVRIGNKTIRHNWRFYICGFDGDTATILCHNKTTERVPIDANNRIFVAGKWFDSRFWDH